MASPFNTMWGGKPELHKIVDSSTGRTHYFFDTPSNPGTQKYFETGFPMYSEGSVFGEHPEDATPEGYYSSPDVSQVRAEWERNFQGIAFPDLSTATLGMGTNAQNNGTPGTFSSQEWNERGNGGHGSWLDQQGGELISDALFAGAGYVGGPIAGGLMAYGLGGDDSAESQRSLRAGSLGGLLGSIFGTPSTSASNTPSDAGGSETIGGSTGSTTLNGGSGTDTLGGSTDNYFGDYLTDPNTGDVYSSDPYGTGVDQSGNPTGQYSDSTFTGDTANTGYDYNSDPNYQQLAQQYGPTIAKGLLGAFGKGGALAGGKQTLGQSILGQLGSDPLSAGFSALPFILALTEANRQGGDINSTIGRMRSLEDSVSGNASPYMNALLNPYDQQTGTGRAALLQDQGLRGIRGSSFGDQSLNSYDYTRDVGRGDIASKALLGSAGLQGNLLGSELGAINARNTNRNLLLGAGLSASGRLFQPEKDPFNLNTLLGLT